MPNSVSKPRVRLFALSGLFACLLASSASAAGAFPVDAESWRIERHGAQIWHAASDVSDQIEAKIVVTKRRPHGDFMDVDFRIELSRVPQGKKYFECLWDLGMKLSGAKPGCLEPGSVWPDENGKVVMYFELTDFVQGEWVQVTLRSTDGEVQKSVRFTPFK